MCINSSREEDLRMIKTTKGKQRTSVIAFARAERRSATCAINRASSSTDPAEGDRSDKQKISKLAD